MRPRAKCIVNVNDSAPAWWPARPEGYKQAWNRGGLSSVRDRGCEGFLLGVHPVTLKAKKSLLSGKAYAFLGGMVKVEQFDMPFVNDLPKREKTRWQKLWERFQEAKRITEVKGMLVPVALAAKIAGVSTQRIHQLIETEQLERIYLDDHPFITEESFLAWAKSERKTGRPPKTPTKIEAAKIALDFARGK